METDNFITPNGILKELSFPLIFKPFAGILRLMGTNFLFVLAALFLETKKIKFASGTKWKCGNQIFELFLFMRAALVNLMKHFNLINSISHPGKRFSGDPTTKEVEGEDYKNILSFCEWKTIL